MRVASSAADGEIKKLREYAANSPDPKRKEELKAFADALGGALYRQKKAAVEFMRDVTIMRGREEAAEAREIMQRRQPGAAATRSSSSNDRGHRASIRPHPPTATTSRCSAWATRWTA